MHGEFLIWIFFNASLDGRNPNLENASVSPAKGPMMSRHLHIKWLIISEADSSRKKKEILSFDYFLNIPRQVVLNLMVNVCLLLTCDRVLD